MKKKTSAKPTFNEVTYSGCGDEVMVLFDEQKNVVGVYTYRNAKILIESKDPNVFRVETKHMDYEVDYRKLKWATGQNPLFVHANNPKLAYQFLIENEFICSEDE